MKNAITIFLFTLGVTLFYNYVGQLVPQKEVHPPATAEISADMSVEQMVAAGEVVVSGKGTCLNCHNGSARFPVFDSIGAQAKTRKEGMSDVEYLAEALYKPNDFIVEPFASGMPAVNKPPIGLSDEEILCVIAYLQSMGGEPSVTMKTKLEYQGTGTAAPAASAPSGSGDGGDKALDVAGIVANSGCAACHNFEQPVRGLGPALNDIGARQSKASLYEALMDPDAIVAEGFPPNVMAATLNGNGFYENLSPKQMKLLVDYLAGLKG